MAMKVYKFPGGDYWYDRSIRSWTVRQVDCDGNQQGEAMFAGTKLTRDSLIQSIVAERHSKTNPAADSEALCPNGIIWRNHALELEKSNKRLTAKLAARTVIPKPGGLIELLTRAREFAVQTTCSVPDDNSLCIDARAFLDETQELCMPACVQAAYAADKARQAQA